MQVSTNSQDRSPAPTVMVVDDDRMTRAFVEKILQRDGVEVVQAEHGEQCLFMALQQVIDAFIIDLQMPDIDSVELCRRLRSIERYRLTPIVVLTANDDLQRLDSVFEAGADDYLTKPVRPASLSSRLRVQIQKTSQFTQMATVRENLNRYISARTQQVVEAYSITGALPQPEEVEVCVMFTDVRGYTALSQTLDPTTLFHKLSHHLGMQVDCVHRHGGYIDKFGGDGIMAVFDAEDRARRACRCALEIIALTKADQVESGDGVMEPGIGVHDGPALIGNIGSEHHLDYSAIGETVNLAARLCGCAAPMSVVVSETVARALDDVSDLQCTSRRFVSLRGLKDPVSVANLRDLSVDAEARPNTRRRSAS